MYYALIGKKTASACADAVINVIRAGFEPATHSLEGCCSIQLSYRTARKKARKGTAFF